MDELNKFVDVLLSNEETEIAVNNDDTYGLYLENEALNIRIYIFSDNDKSICFDFSFMFDDNETFIKDYSTNKQCPKFKVTDINSVKPILDKIVDHFEKGYNSNSTLKNYANIFKQFLRGEEIPKEYHVAESEKSFDLTKDKDKILCSIDKKLVSHIKLEMYEQPSLTYVQSIRINEFGGYSSFTIHIPKYAINDYPMLQIKENDGLLPPSTICFNDILKSLEGVNTKKRSGIHDLLDYFKLNRDLQENLIVNEGPQVKRSKI